MLAQFRAFEQLYDCASYCTVTAIGTDLLMEPDTAVTVTV